MSKQPIRNAHASAKVLWLPALLAIVLCLFAFAMRARSAPMLPFSILGAAAALLIYAVVIRQQALAAGRVLTMEFVPKAAHWVQLIMHSCIYAYWGWYWPQVYHESRLSSTQIVFVYALDMLVCWSRRDNGCWVSVPFPSF